MKVVRILAATDFSVAGDRAVRSAALCARREGAALRIVHVTPSRQQLAGFWRSGKAALHDVQRQAAAALKRVADQVDPERALELSTGVMSGPAARNIARAARDHAADLLVIGARGEHDTATGQPGLGGTASKVMALAGSPLWLVREAGNPAPANVLAAVDLGESSTAVLGWAAQQAAGGQLHVFHAYDVPFASRLQAYGFASGTLQVYTEEEQARLDGALSKLIATAGIDPDARQLEIHRLIERGDAVSRLFVQIRRLNPGLVVVGQHGGTRRRTASTKFGSVCRYAASFSPTDVLIVPPHRNS